MDSSSQPKTSEKDNDIVLAATAYKVAFKKLIEERRRLGETIVVWRDGKVQHIPAVDIILPDEEK